MSLMRESQLDYYHITSRRQALINYKKAMMEIYDENGISYWDSNKLPPSVPYWRFQEIK